MSAPTAAEIDEVDSGVNDQLADAAVEPRDPDPYIAGIQDDRCFAGSDADLVRAIHEARVRDERDQERE